MNVLPWRNAGETAKFPFREAASLLSQTDRALPDDFLVDAQIFIPAHLGSQPYLQSLRVAGSKILGTVTTEDGTVLGLFDILAADINNGSAALVSPAGAARGTLVFGSQAIEAFRALSLGDNLFSLDATGFESSCVFQMPGNILHELVFDGPASGKVVLVEGEGVELVKTAVNSFRLDAKGSVRPIADCCDDPGVAIKTINTAVPNEFGNINFNLEPFSEPEKPEDQRQVLRIRPIANGLEFYLSNTP